MPNDAFEKSLAQLSDGHCQVDYEWYAPLLTVRVSWGGYDAGDVMPDAESLVAGGTIATGG